MQKLYFYMFCIIVKVDQNYSLDCNGLEEKTQLQLPSRRGPAEDEMSDTFEEYLEKTNMLCQDTNTEHYFLPNSQKSDFVWFNHSDIVIYIDIYLIPVFHLEFYINHFYMSHPNTLGMS